MNTLLQERFLTLADGRRVALLESLPAQESRGTNRCCLPCMAGSTTAQALCPWPPF